MNCSTRLKKSLGAASLLFFFSSITYAQDPWEEDFDPKLLQNIEGMDKETKLKITLPLGYVFHRTDVEKFFVCDEKLKGCEQREKDRQEQDSKVTMSFWNSDGGKVVLIAIGFLAGAGTTIGIGFAIKKI